MMIARAGAIAGVFAAIAVGVATATAVGASGLKYRPGQTVITSLGQAQRTVPFLVRYPTYLPDGDHLASVQVAFPPVPNVPQRIQVNLYYGPARHAVFVTDTGGHVQLGGGGVTRRHIDGVPAAVQILRRKGASTVYSVALYFPHSSCLLTSQASQLPLGTLEAMAASVRAR